ncbi:unnamed protein product [Scytosiphon promiscuus]
MDKGEKKQGLDHARPPPRPEFNACFSTSRAGAADDRTSSQGPEMRWGLWSPDDAAWMRLVRDNYNKHHRHAPATPVSRGGGRQPLIPLKIHHIWLGSPLPEVFSRLRESWLSRHGGRDSSGHGEEKDASSDRDGRWEARLWTDEDVDGFGLENRAAYDAAGNFGQKSDIFRYEILLRHGGLYVDVDFLCLGSFEDLHASYEFYAGVSNTGTFELNNGLVGCRPGHPIMRDIVERIRGSYSSPAPSHLLQSSSSSSETAPAAPAPSGMIAGEKGCDGKRSTEMVVGGDPLTALMGALGGSGSGGGGGQGGLLASLLGGEERDRLEQAVRVEPGSATETITKTGPGVFTRAVMAWMVTACAGEDFSRSTVCTGSSTSIRAEDFAACRPDEPLAACEADPSDADASGRRGLGAGAGGGGEGSGTSSAPAHGHDDPSTTTHPPSTSHKSDGTSASTVAAIPTAIMILPPSYLYPIPNNAAAAKAGVLIGDGRESGIRERAGDLLSSESLAVHLWGRSWQHQ